MAYTVLVVDDEPQIHTFIRISLMAEGFEYIGAGSIGEALERFQSLEPDVVVLDLGLPDGDGMRFLQQVRQTSRVPALILTARDEEDEKIRLLEAGANDYLSKPFGVRELIVRIKVLVRDLVEDGALSDVVHCGRIRLQQSTHEAWLDDDILALTKKEFAFMLILAMHQNKLVKQTDLLEQIWGETHREDTHYLRILVSQLRRKLNDSVDEQALLKTETGLGYRLLN
ncbi:response regulator transcription factor [Vibrio nitrifigilis]|uniref:Response regulator transcription factor n=1 Tax=Vibrio nitrifigilis TaxID=2789781 RepID=A0ABS0GD11_9VIBR|nr:response regulator transcription factor [Vibrio nitrifigilis]MBF9000289.1 response regulator transcription factor [Vibrio nitrifigilis]